MKFSVSVFSPPASHIYFNPLLPVIFLSPYAIVGRRGHTSVVLSDGSVLVMGGDGLGVKNDVWKSVDGGASWIMVTSSAGWTGNDMLIDLIQYPS